jgi:hypothetical protein
MSGVNDLKYPPAAPRTFSARRPLTAAFPAALALAALVASALGTAAMGAAATAPTPAVSSPGATSSAPSATPPSTDGIESAVRWMPQAAQLVLRVRFADMRTSSLFRSLMASKPLFAAELRPVERFVSEAGLDLGRDVDLGWIGTDGREGGASVAILSGRLDSAALGARLEKRGARSTPYGEAALYALPRRAPEAGGAGEIVVAFPRAGMALVGSRSWVTSTLERAQGRGVAASTALLRLAGRADTGASIWSAAAGGAVSEKIRAEWSSGQLGGEDFSGIQTLVATFRIGGDLAIDSEAKATGEDADTLALTLKGLIAVSGLRASMSDPSLAEVLRGTRVDRTGTGVRLTTRIPASLASRL